MSWLKRKPKKQERNEAPSSPVLPNAFAKHASELAGLTPEEILKLLQSLERIDASITVTHRRADKSGKGSKVVDGRRRKMTIDDAVEHEKKRIEERNEKEKSVRELLGLKDAEFERPELNEDVYPKRLTPADIVRYVDAGEKRLEEIDRLRERRKKVYSPQEEIVLKVLTEIKKGEAPRVAHKIAEMQRQMVQGKTLEELDAERKRRIENIQAEAHAAVETASAEEQTTIEEELTASRTLTPFDKNLRTLTEEAGELVDENVDAAASIVRQWIGTTATGMEN